MRVSVVIPARDAAATLGRALAAVAAQSVAAHDVVVVDDASDDRTPEIVAAAGVRHVRHDAPRGAGAARNAGAAASRGDVLAFTDADCFPTDRWLEQGLAALEGADLVQGAVHPEPGLDLGPYQRTLSVEGPNPYFPTANILVRRSLFDELGGFEDWLVGRGGRALRAPHGEDTLFGWQASRRGARIVFAPDALVHHAVLPRTRGEWILSHWNARHQPMALRRVPELRETAFFRHWFYRRRSALFDVAVAGVLGAAAARSPWPAVSALPYARMLRREVRAHPGTGYLPARVAADAVTAAALVYGSIRSRHPVL